MPAISNSLQQQNLRLNNVSFMQGFASGNSGGGGGDSQQQVRLFPRFDGGKFFFAGSDTGRSFWNCFHGRRMGGRGKQSEHSGLSGSGILPEEKTNGPRRTLSFPKGDSYEYISGDYASDHGDKRSTHRAELEQHVSAIAGGAAAESGSDRSCRSFAVCGTTGAVQRTERGDIDLHTVAGICAGFGNRRQDPRAGRFRRAGSSSPGAAAAAALAANPALALGAANPLSSAATTLSNFASPTISALTSKIQGAF